MQVRVQPKSTFDIKPDTVLSKAEFRFALGIVKILRNPLGWRGGRHQKII